MASLAIYNFKLYYRAGKTNIGVDTLLRVSWPDFMPKALGTHHQVPVVAIKALQEDTLEGPASPIEAYSCNLHILDLVGDGLQVNCMTTDDWHQTKRADPVLSLVIMRMQEGTLGQSPCKAADLPELCMFLWEHNHLKVRQGILYRKLLSKESQEPNCNWSCQPHIWEPC